MADRVFASDRSIGSAAIPVYLMGGGIASSNSSRVPLGYVQVTNLSSPVGIGPVPTNATLAIINVSGGSVRWRDDNISPTSSVGMPVNADNGIQYNGVLSQIQFIQVSSGSPATLDVSFYR